jgi:hypothetical protein
LTCVSAYFPQKEFRIPFFSPELVEAYYQAGANNKADELAKDISNKLTRNIEYFKQLKNEKGADAVINEVRLDLYILQETVKITEKYSPELSADLMKAFERYYSIM